MGGNRLIPCNYGTTYRLGRELLAIVGGLTLDVIQSSWAGWTRILPVRKCAQSRQEEKKCFQPWHFLNLRELDAAPRKTIHSKLLICCEIAKLWSATFFFCPG